MAFELEVMGEDAGTMELLPLRRVVAVLSTLAERLNLPNGTINLAFVSDAQMQRMNKEYSGNDYPTDVLSFNYLESGGPIGDVVGEMAISTETAQRQADSAAGSLADEIALLALHGVLHIAGYDHQTASEQEQLGALQQEIMKAAECGYREFKWTD